MNMVDEMAVEIHENGKSLKRSLKDRMFDVIGVGLVIAVGLVSLGVIELREITPREIINIVLEAVPFYIGCVTLAMNYYRKGVYAGKESDGFSTVVRKYSKKVNALNGKQLENLNDFCCEYNEKGLKMAQENFLRNAAVRYDRFNDEWEDKDGNIRPALKTMSKETLVTEYNARTAEYVIKARDTQVKGINVNILLGNTYDCDITNLGPNEKELASQRRKQYAGSSEKGLFWVSPECLELFDKKEYRTMNKNVYGKDAKFAILANPAKPNEPGTVGVYYGELKAGDFVVCDYDYANRALSVRIVEISDRETECVGVVDCEIMGACDITEYLDHKTKRERRAELKKQMIAQAKKYQEEEYWRVISESDPAMKALYEEFKELED